MLLMERPDAADGVTRGTGHGRQEWFALLEKWGAYGRPYRDVAAWLVDEHGLSRWWAQKLTVEYQEARGVRPPGVRPNGTFEVGASKVVAAPVERVFRAIAEPEIRAAWLGEFRAGALEVQPDRSVRFDWTDESSRVTFVLEPKDGDRTLVAIRHDRLGDAHAAAQAKAFWRERLDVLKAVCEG